MRSNSARRRMRFAAVRPRPSTAAEGASLPFVGDSQARPPLGPTSLQDNPAIFRRHAYPKAMRFLAREAEEDDATPNSLSEQLDAHTEARQFIETLPTLNAELYDLKRLHNDLRRDVNSLREVWHDIELPSVATCIVGLTLAVNLCNVRSTCVTCGQPVTLIPNRLARRNSGCNP